MNGEVRTPLSEELASINNAEARDALEIIFRHAAKHAASDLFLQAYGTHYSVSMRQMGFIRPIVILSAEQGLQILHLIKSSAGIDLTERRHPLDGRWSYRVDDVDYDFRINTIGTLHGEDIVLRILPASGSALDMKELGFVGNQYSDLRGMLGCGSGLLLVTGPVGVGKSTTLYACLEHLNDGKRMIHTLEDPIEHVIKGIRQCQVHPKINLGFLELLRGVLRQSPDVIMIGEIRDEETADTAVRAANSGHLVMTTLHSPLAAGAVQSLLAFGVNPYFLSNCLLGIVAQRLVRKLSPTSRKMYDVSHAPETFQDVRPWLDSGQGNVIYGPDEEDPESLGGYVGLSGLFEVLKVDRRIKELVAQGAGVAELHRAAVERGMLDFGRAALLKTAQGITGIEEIGRVIPTVELDEYES